MPPPDANQGSASQVASDPTVITQTRCAQIIHSGAELLARSTPATGAHIGGSACGYQELSWPLVTPATAEQAGRQAVCLCTATRSRERTVLPRYVCWCLACGVFRNTQFVNGMATGRCRACHLSAEWPDLPDWLWALLHQRSCSAGAVRCRRSEPGRSLPDQRKGVVGDDNRNRERYRRVQPVPAATSQNYSSGRGDACSCSCVRNRVELDGCDRQVTLLSFVSVLITVLPKNERATSHYQRGNAGLRDRGFLARHSGLSLDVHRRTPPAHANRRGAWSARCYHLVLVQLTAAASAGAEPQIAAAW